MYFDDLLHRVEGAEAAELLEQIAAFDLPFALDADTTTVALHLPAFYDGVALIRLTDPTWPEPAPELYFLRHEGILSPLDGRSPPIHEMNLTAGARITDANVLHYLEFFCFFVRGEGGPFLIVQDLSNRHIPPLTDPRLAEQIGALICPASYSGRDGRHNRSCEATVFYGNALFAARFTVTPTGNVTMDEDEPLLSDLPVHVTAPIA